MWGCRENEGAEGVMHTEIVKVLLELELELEGSLSEGAQHTNAWLGQEQLRAAAQGNIGWPAH